MSLPQPSSFADAVEIIQKLRSECYDVLVAIDQPIIVPNPIASRPVDGVARSLMSRLRSAVQSASRNKESLFGDEAPIWKFISDVGSCEYSGKTGYAGNKVVDFEAAKTSTGSTHMHLIEVYPALALSALEPAFTTRRRAARYNPCRETFCLGDWRLVCETVRRHADEFDLQPLSKWVKELESTSKRDQDMVDAVLCLILALQWRHQSHGVCVIGGLDTGYIVTPTSGDTQKILQEAASKKSIYISPENAL